MTKGVQKSLAVPWPEFAQLDLCGGIVFHVNFVDVAVAVHCGRLDVMRSPRRYLEPPF